MDNNANSKAPARKWPYPRQMAFEADLRSSSADWFKSKGFPTHPKMPYCLGTWENWPSNIILKEVSDYIAKKSAEAQEYSKPFPLHKFVHHGLSSQAMAFNLFGPLIVRNDYEPIQQSLSEIGIDLSGAIESISFEYEDRKVFNEDSGQPTSLDIAIMNSESKPLVLIESKLVEREFGGCSVFSSGDCTGASLEPVAEDVEGIINTQRLQSQRLKKRLVFSPCRNWQNANHSLITSAAFSACGKKNMRLSEQSSMKQMKNLLQSGTQIRSFRLTNVRKRPGSALPRCHHGSRLLNVKARLYSMVPQVQERPSSRNTLPGTW